MTYREARPTNVICARCGRHDADAASAREAQIAWCVPFKRKLDADKMATKLVGTHTDPQELHRTGVYLCSDCWRRRYGDAKKRSLWPFWDRIHMTLRQLVSVWIEPPANVTHDLFGNEIERRKAI